jgi:cytochrome bd-type quinol oxidase subunit 2
MSVETLYKGRNPKGDFTDLDGKPVSKQPFSWKPFIIFGLGVLAGSIVMPLLLVACIGHAMKGLDIDTRQYATGIVYSCGNPLLFLDTGHICTTYLNEYPAFIAGIAPTHQSIRAEMDRAHQIARAALEVPAQ